MQRFVFIAPLVFLLAAAAGVSRVQIVGQWREIKNLDDPHVREIGRYAVEEHNKLQEDDLVFQRVCQGDTQVVSGIKYRLSLLAAKGSEEKKYQAIVWEKAWENFRKMESFQFQAIILEKAN